MMGNLYKNQNSKFTLWAKRLVWEFETDIATALSEVENATVAEQAELDTNALKRQAIQKLNAIEGLTKQSQEYKDAVAKIDAKVRELEAKKAYFVERTNVQTTYADVLVDGFLVDGIANRDKAVQAIAALSKLGVLREKARESGDNWTGKIDGLKQKLTDYYTKTADECHALYLKAAGHSGTAVQEAMDADTFPKWEQIMAEYKTKIDEFTQSEKQGWPGVGSDLKLIGSRRAEGVNYQVEYNYFEAYKSAMLAKKTGVGAETANQWLAGAEQKKGAMDAYNDCLAKSDEILLTLKKDGQNPAIFQLTSTGQGQRDAAGKAFQEAIRAWEKSDWIQAKEKFLQAGQAYDEVLTEIKDSVSGVVEDADKITAYNTAVDGLADTVGKIKDTVLYDQILKSAIEDSQSLLKGEMSLDDKISALHKAKAAIDAEIKGYEEAKNRVRESIRRAVAQNQREQYWTDSAKGKVIRDYLNDPRLITSVPDKYRNMLFSNNLRVSGVMVIDHVPYRFFYMYGDQEAKVDAVVDGLISLPSLHVEVGMGINMSSTKQQILALKIPDAPAQNVESPADDSTS